MADRFIFADYAVSVDFELATAQSTYASGQMEPSHVHDFYELVLIESGKGFHIFGGERHEIGPGNVFLIKPQEEHAYESLENLALVSIIFLPSALTPMTKLFHEIAGFQVLFHVEPMLNAEQKRTGKLYLPEKILPQAVELAETMQFELEQQQEGYKVAALSAFFQLLLLISRHCKFFEGRISRYARRIGCALSFMEQHLKEDLTLELLAREANMPVSIFRRVFTETQKISPISYLIRLRLRKAAILLRSTRLQIGEIAFEVGFHDSNYFSHQFHKLYGMSPMLYRQSRLGNYFLQAEQQK